MQSSWNRSTALSVLWNRGCGRIPSGSLAAPRHGHLKPKASAGSSDTGSGKAGIASLPCRCSENTSSLLSPPVASAIRRWTLTMNCSVLKSILGGVIFRSLKYRLEKSVTSTKTAPPPSFTQNWRQIGCDRSRSSRRTTRRKRRCEAASRDSSRGDHIEQTTASSRSSLRLNRAGTVSAAIDAQTVCAEVLHSKQERCLTRPRLAQDSRPRTRSPN